MPSRRAPPALRLALVAVVLGSAGAGASACHNEASRRGGVEADAASPTDVAAQLSLSGDASTVELGEDAGPSAASRRREPRDGGGAPVACEGSRLSLVAAALEPRCAIGESEWRALTAGGGPPNLRQEAQRDGDAIVLAVVNGGTSDAVVPLRFQPIHSELAFSVLAETEARGVFELAPPALEQDLLVARPRPPTMRAPDAGARERRWGVLDELDGGWPSARHVHTARIRLTPGGRATVRLTPDPRIVKRLDRTCVADAGEACLPPRLPPGRTVLHVAQLVTGFDAGAPARVEWRAP